MNSVVFRALARADVLEQHDWYHSQLAHAAAEGFVDALADTTAMPIDAPASGRLETLANSRLSGMRSVGVNGYASVRIYDRASEEGIEVVRVLHVAQDVLRILGRE